MKYSLLPTYLAWEAFGEKNGISSLQDLNTAIEKYRARNNIIIQNPQVGCIILTDVFYFDEQDWIPAPENFSRSIVQSKRYYTENADGLRLFQEVQERLRPSIDLTAPGERYRESMTKHRLGQGAFRVVVTDAYQRRCAITGEKTLPVRQAAHIKPYAAEGPYSVNNGLLLKPDFHTLLMAAILPSTRITGSMSVNDFMKIMGMEGTITNDVDAIASGIADKFNVIDFFNDLISEEVFIYSVLIEKSRLYIWTK